MVPISPKVSVLAGYNGTKIDSVEMLTEKPNPERNGCALTANRTRSIPRHNPGRRDLRIQSAKVCKNKS